MTQLTAQDIYLFHEGTHARLYTKLGAHPAPDGTQFRVWAPSASRVAVVGDFNGWQSGKNPMTPHASSGIWEAFVPGVRPGTTYKYRITTPGGEEIEKADPMAVLYEVAPKTASVVWDLDSPAYAWRDETWMAERQKRNALDAPISTYEVHLGSWMRVPEEGNRSLSYRELAVRLVEHVRRTGFTHVEFLPVMEHPFFGSWGYQTTGYFAASSRYGTPQDFMHLVDALHQAGIGVILDWVPSHFPTDAHALARFDGTHLYEHSDPRQGFQPDWNTSVFNYGRHEVRSFLTSSALFWLEKFHVDGLRVDAVASMLYLDYSRKAGEWIPNQFGGRENLEAVAFLRRLNEDVYREYAATQTIAEESTAWPMVTRPTWIGGLGFGFKWDMGWMHDTLQYMRREPVHRKFHQQELTFRALYAFTENYVLALSHDEVVYGKGSLVNKMPGDEWQQFANLRLLYGYMFGLPGKKLLFMGGEFGQHSEWNHDGSLDWDVLQYPVHAGMQQWVGDLNRVYAGEAALHELDVDASGMEWIDASDAQQSTMAFVRKARSSEELVLVVCNFTPVPRTGFRVGVPRAGFWKEILNSDATLYAGSGQGNFGGVAADEVGMHGRPWSVNITLPPLAVVFFKNG